MENPTIFNPEAHDDRWAPEHAQWHALVGRAVVAYVRGASAFPGGGTVLFRVQEARISRDEAFLLLREWTPSTTPASVDQWVGGTRSGMYCMCLRPDGGFQVAGDKFLLVGRGGNISRSSVVKPASKRLSSDALSELKKFLDGSA